MYPEEDAYIRSLTFGNFKVPDTMDHDIILQQPVFKENSLLEL